MGSLSVALAKEVRFVFVTSSMQRFYFFFPHVYGEKKEEILMASRFCLVIVKIESLKNTSVLDICLAEEMEW